MTSRKVKLPPINYTSRDFATIKNDLENYARRYYPDTFQDFSEASFGSLMLDMTAYVGDILSFYVDYQVNESFLDTALEYNNISRLSKQMGFKQPGAASSQGFVTLYIVVPASSTAVGPDLRYAPVLKNGTKFASNSGAVFTLLDDVDFANADNDIVVATTNSTTGLPTGYAIKAMGRVKSGELRVQYITVGQYQRFPKFTLDDTNISEIVSITDTSGNRYYEVDYLTQDTVYVPVVNRSVDKELVPFIMKPKGVPRRFIVEHVGSSTTIQFGYGSEANITSDVVSDPSNVVLDMHGKNYVSDRSFDPTNLIETDKLGVAPANTVLSIIYRANGANNINISTDSLTSVTDVDIRFKNTNLLSAGSVREVIASLEFENEEPIVGDTAQISAEEIRQRAYGVYAAQNRAVTKEDYKALIYSMPSKFGSIKRLNIVQDKNSFKRNLNLYVVSENVNGNLIATPTALKNNLKTWISNYKMINDTIDILDGKIVNIAIEYEIMVDKEENRFSAISQANTALARRFSRTQFEFGEPFKFSDIFQVLKNIDSVLDVGDVRVVRQTGPSYSSVDFNINAYTTPDGRSIIPPEDYIFEIKFPSQDIRGSVK
jgi:hypothetical protein